MEGDGPPRTNASGLSLMIHDPAKSRRIELILRQIDSLPTLPAVAVKLLSLTSRDDTDARQVCEVVASDQALTAKILALCRRADLGLRQDTITIEQAVVMLGFSAVRNAALSLKVFELLETAESLEASPGAALDAPTGSSGPVVRPGTTGGPTEPAPASGPSLLNTPAPGTVRFNRQGFWRHSLAVGVLCELIAQAHRQHSDLQPSDAFVCGLLHDIGKVALDYILPKSFARVIELVELNHGNIAEFERRIIGVDHHTAGKRLAEQWMLPHRLQDCIWLHGSAYESLPASLEHRRLVGLVSLADLLARRQHIGYSGNFIIQHDPDALARAMGLEPQKVEQAVMRMPEELHRRAALLGLDEQPSRELLMQSIQNANAALGRLNSTLERRTQSAARQAQALDAITAFHASGAPGRSVHDVIESVVQSAIRVLGPGFYVMLHQPSSGEPWLVVQFDTQGRELRQQLLDPPPHAPDLVTLNPTEPLALNLASVLPWIADYLIESQDMRSVRLLPLSSGWGTAAVLLHDRPRTPPWRELSAVTATWGAAIAAAGQHEGARRIGEELAQANRALAETQDRLLRTESLARLGEMAAGAAHEMNNPLAVISGRSQLLAIKLPPGSNESKAAATIAEQAHRLSDLITALRFFADPPKPDVVLTDVSTLLNDVISEVSTQVQPSRQGTPAITLQVRQPMQAVDLDPQQFATAVREMLLNAVQANPKTSVHLSAQIDSVQRRLVIQVSDDGVGMDGHTLAHAMDPFFSNKPAGRRVGMGLTRAQQLAAAHGGQVELRSAPGLGTVATLWVPLDSQA